MNVSYYQRFGIILKNPHFPGYLRWAYTACLKDVESLGLTPNLSKKDFTAILCGCGNEQTADTFIQYILERNKDPKIVIIDQGSEQIWAVKALVAKKYANQRIRIQQINALNLTKFVPKHSVDWLETDGFIEYFDHDSLNKLFGVWRSVLHDDGYITTRDCITTNFLTRIADWFRVTIGKIWLGVALFPHTWSELHQLIQKNGLIYTTGETKLFTYKRIAMIKRK